MKRTGIARGDKPLKRGDSQLKRTAFPRQGPTRQERPEKTPEKARGSRRVDTGPSTTVRALVGARDGGQCLICGGPATNIHHRRNRGMGNGNRAKANVTSNLMSLCGSGTTGCHGMVTDPGAFGMTLLENQANGWVLSTNAIVDSTTVAVLTYCGWFLLDDEGNKIPCLPTDFD